MIWIKLFAKCCVWIAALISIYMGIMSVYVGFVTLSAASLIMVIAAAMIDSALRSVDDDES